MRRSLLTETHEPTPVADAVSRSIYAVKDAENFQSNLQYDLPEGRSRKALEQYFGVMNQARREELARLLGVDIYI
ncbi:chromosome segregation ATPase [Vibrio sp. PP-XX7]